LEVWRLKSVFPDSESKEATEIERNKYGEGRKKGRKRKKKRQE
jgi:hypothetical protein